RRLSKGRRPWKDDARKITFLETTDGVAILGYAGLGATARGTEPADWMSAVLRGRNFPLEQSLGMLARGMQDQFPTHMMRTRGSNRPGHHVIVPALLGGEPRLYTIDLVLAPTQFRCVRHEAPQPVGPRPPRLVGSGSGVSYLLQDRTWMRSLLRVVKA